VCGSVTVFPVIFAETAMLALKGEKYTVFSLMLEGYGRRINNTRLNDVIVTVHIAF
jgi:hypothetical protein